MLKKLDYIVLFNNFFISLIISKVSDIKKDSLKYNNQGIKEDKDELKFMSGMGLYI